jgi:hypothetical protein
VKSASLRLTALVFSMVFLTGCTAGSRAATPTSSPVVVDHTVQALIDGEWVVTRTVTKTDDVNNPAHAVAAVSTRDVQFANVDCAGGPCSGTAASGPTTGSRESAPFTSTGNTISYEFSGFLNCLNPADGTVLVVNGFEFHSQVRLTVAESEEIASGSNATKLEGTLTYTDNVTNDALGAGCTREPIHSTTEFSLVAIRADSTGIAPSPSSSP